MRPVIARREVEKQEEEEDIDVGDDADIDTSGFVDVLDDNDDDEEEDDEDDDEEEGDDSIEGGVRRRGQYHADLLLQHVKDLKGTETIPWIESLDISSSKPTVVVNVDDDFQRELAFYKQALEAAFIGRERVVAAGVKFDRPNDFFAEMIKSDEHMKKVRQHLADESEQIKRSEEAAKQRALRKYGKQVQAEKLQERAKQKTKNLDKINMVRKGRANVEKALADDDDFEVNVDSSKSSSSKPGLPSKSSKRAIKDSKFGFGGKKRGSKSNTADSTADLSGFSVKRNKEIPKAFAAGKAGGRGKGSPKNKRPGKQMRQNHSNKKQNRSK